MSTIISPGLVILHGNRLEDLRDTAVAWVGQQPLAPLENDVFLVQSNGMAQWLKLALAGKQAYGISAANKFLMPSRFLWQAYRSVLGPAAVPETSPFDESRLVWRLYRHLSRGVTGDVYLPLQRYLGDNADVAKRFGLAQKLADLFDQYQVYRADWLNAWQDGRDLLPGLADARAGTELAVPDAQRWQPALWRDITCELPVTLQLSGRSHVHQRFVDALQRSPRTPRGLPRRLHVFGLSSMPTQMLEAIDALARHVQVLVYVVNPCRHYWADILDGRELLGITRHRHARKPGLPPTLSPEQMAASTNPLLAAWGKQGRDFIGLLYRYDAAESSRADIDLFTSPLSESAPTLLQQVQYAIYDLQPLPQQGEQRILLNTQDTSIQFHQCHSRQREVEVLQDRLLALFEHCPDLQPRDVVVMAPEIDRYAAHVEAVFGNVLSQDARYIPFTLADRPERACHPLARALETLLHLPELRLSVSDVLGLLDVAAVRARFDISENDVPVLQRWMIQSGIRWGLSARQRAHLDLPDNLHENTWQFGLRRVLLGYATGCSEAWCGVEPFAAVAGLEGALAGRLTHWVAALETLWLALQDEASLAQWGEHLKSLLHTFFLPQDDSDEWLVRRFENAVNDWQAACREGGLTDEKLPLAVVREALMIALDGEGLSQRFLAGCVNFCTLMPMRSIPFKVICLLGMNDGDYPRSRVPVDFDLMAGRYRPGDRSRREDDRYLFLEALLSAREVFYISHVGRSIRDDSVRPASVLVAQLRDYLQCAFRLPDNENVADALTLQHPLQPFSKKYFNPAAGAAEKPALFTYASEWRDVHQRYSAVTVDAGLAASLRVEPLTLLELERFLRQPVDYFFAQRLKVRFPRKEEVDADCEIFAFDGLDDFALGTDLIASRLQAGASWPQTLMRWRREGRLPTGAWGEAVVSRVVAQAEQVWTGLQSFEQRHPQSVEPVELLLPHARLGINDWVAGVRSGDAGLALLDWRPSASRGSGNKGLKFHYFLSSWVKQVALAAAGDSVQPEFVAADHHYVLPRLTQAQAQGQLSVWLDAWQQGMMQPLPVAFKSALTFLRSRDSTHADPWEQAEKTFADSSDFARAERDESIVLARTFTSVHAMPDFDAWAERLYGGLYRWLTQEASA